jgi:hypothetical protein
MNVHSAAPRSTYIAFSFAKFAQAKNSRFSGAPRLGEKLPNED